MFWVGGEVVCFGRRMVVSLLFVICFMMYKVFGSLFRLFNIFWCRLVLNLNFRLSLVVVFLVIMLMWGFLILYSLVGWVMCFCCYCLFRFMFWMGKVILVRLVVCKLML